MKPVKVPIENEIDLHTFQHREVPGLLEEYFLACIDAKIFSVRVIHGKGKGILKKNVYSHLEKNPHVISYRDSGFDSGGWGATQVELQAF
jgi:DNA-nicking Smr family endonuclease